MVFISHRSQALVEPSPHFRSGRSTPPLLEMRSMADLLQDSCWGSPPSKVRNLLPLSPPYQLRAPGRSPRCPPIRVSVTSGASAPVSRSRMAGRRYGKCGTREKARRGSWALRLRKAEVGKKTPITNKINRLRTTLTSAASQQRSRVLIPYLTCEAGMFQGPSNRKTFRVTCE